MAKPASRPIHFTTLGGEQSFELLLGASEDSPIVIVAPALGVRASYYSRLCKKLRAAGLGAAAVDAPGHGASPVRASRTCDWGYAELVDHYAAALTAVHRERPTAPLYLLGHSIGGQIALMLGGTGAPALRGTIVVASGYPYWRAWDGIDAYRIRAITSLFSGVARAVGYFPGKRIGFGGREAKRFVSQWARVGRTGHYRLPGFDGEALLAAPGPPVLAIYLAGDHLVPKRAMHEPLERANRTIEFIEWTDPPPNIDHNRWPSKPGFVIEHAVAFIRATT